MIFVDTAQKDRLEKFLVLPWVKGFTTNPTLVAKAAGVDSLSADDYVKFCSSLCNLSGSEQFHHITAMMIQGFGDKESIKRQAGHYVSILGDKSSRLWIKILPTEAALSCIPDLKALGVKILVTAVFTNTQAQVAMEAGADGIALYLGRLRRFEENWVPIVRAIQDTLEHHEKMFLIASLPDLGSVDTAFEYSHDLTIPPDVVANLVTCDYSERAVSAFDAAIVPSQAVA